MDFFVPFHTRLSSSFVAPQVAQVGEHRVGVCPDRLREFHLLVERQVFEPGEEVSIEDPLGDRARDRVVLDDAAAGGRDGFSFSELISLQRAARGKTYR